MYVVLDRVLVDLCAKRATPVVSLFPCSSKSSARAKSRALEGRHVSLKSSLRVQDGDKRVAGRNESEKCFPNDGFTYLAQ